MNMQQQLQEILETGMSQTEIADRVRVTQPTISRLARGQWEDTRASTARRINELHVDIFGPPPAPETATATATATEEAA